MASDLVVLAMLVQIFLVFSGKNLVRGEVLLIGMIAIPFSLGASRQRIREH